MFNFIFAIFRVILLPFSERLMDIVIGNAILKKENEILKRKRRKNSSSGLVIDYFMH